MSKINTVIDGDYKDKPISSSFGNIYLNISTWGNEQINKDHVTKIEYLQDVFSEKNEYSLVVKLYFKSGKESVVWVDNDISEKIKAIWPENRLTKLLQVGYTVIGYSTCMLATSGLGAGSMAHNILLQKGTNIQKITIITNGQKELGRNFHIFSNEK